MPESAIGDLPFFRLGHHCLTVTQVCFLPLARVVCREVGVIWGQGGTLFGDRILQSAAVMRGPYFGGLQRLRADREGNGES